MNWDNDEFTFYVHRDYTARFFPWWGVMAYGVMKVGGPGEGVWRSRSRERLLEKMERSARKMHRSRGNLDEPTLKVQNRYQPERTT